MTRIENIENLKCCVFGEVFYEITKGTCTPFVFCGDHPKINGITAIYKNDYTDARVFNQRSCDNSVILTGEYNSKEIGEIIIKQLSEKIESVEKIYIYGKV